MLRPGLTLFFLSLLCLGVGCARPDLPAEVVRAATEPELAAFRTELGGRFSAAQLVAFDTALQELQLAGMDRHPTAAARAAAMRAQVHGQSVRAVEILGWEARGARLRSEIASLTPTLEQDLRTRERDGPATSPTVRNRIENVQDILARLRDHLAATEAQLAAWGVGPSR